MSQRIASLYAELSADDTKLKSALKGGKDDLSKFKGGLNDVVQGLTGFNIAQLAGAGAIVTLGNAVKGAIKDTIDYAATVRDMSRISGASAEETSRMIQLTDDLGLELGDLQTAARGAAQKGVVLTTESLAEMSDQYLKLAPGVERNTFLLNNFGRSGLEMAKVLVAGSDKIREMSGAIADNMVLTQQQVDQARQWERATDDLNDSITGLKYSVGNYTLGPLTELVQLTNTAIQYSDKYKGTFLQMNPVFQAFGIGMDFATGKVRDMNAADEAARVGMGDLKLATDEQRQAAVDLAANEDILTQALKDGNSAAEGFVGMQESSERALGRVSSALDGVVSAQGRLEDAQKSWKEKAGNDVLTLLDQSGIKGDKYVGALGAIDSAYGTGLTTQYNYKEDLKQAVKEFQKSGDVNAFQTALGNVASEFMPLDENIKTAKADLEKFNGMLDTLNGRVVDTYVVTHHIDVNGDTPYTPPDTNDNNGHGKRIGKEFARGGDFIVPPGYPNDTYPMRVSSGERVTVTPAGQSAGPVQINVNSSLDVERLTNIIIRKLGRLN